MYKIKLSPYHRLFYNEWKIDPQRRDYNVVLDQQLHGTLDVSRLRSALVRFVADHLLLNSHIEAVDEELYWVVNDGITELDYFESQITDAEIFKYASQAFDLERGPLYRSVIIKLADNRFRFIIVSHHVLVDGLSTDLGVIKQIPLFYLYYKLILI